MGDRGRRDGDAWELIGGHRQGTWTFGEGFGACSGGVTGCSLQTPQTIAASASGHAEPTAAAG